MLQTGGLGFGRRLALGSGGSVLAIEVVVVTADHGEEFMEHGSIVHTKTLYDELLHVPLIFRGPGVPRGVRVRSMAALIDIVPTVLALAGIAPPPGLDGRSLLPLLRGEKTVWRDHILYEYHWEWNFPATPTTLAIRTDRWKYIYYHGVWDHNGYYDLRTDPYERHNLINVPAFQDRISELQRQLFTELEQRGGLLLPIRPPAGERLDQRKLK